MSRSLSPCPAEVQVERLIAEADHITLVVRVFRPVAPCPECTRPSYRIHSYFEPRLAELPWNRIPVKIRLRTRRFFRDTEDCAQRIFTERLPETTEAYARRTLRMEQALRWLALALGNLDHGDPEMLLFSMTRFFKFLPGEQRQAFLRGLSEKAS